MLFKSYTYLKLKLFHDRGRYHIETGFYMIKASVMKGLRLNKLVIQPRDLVVLLKIVTILIHKEIESLILWLTYSSESQRYVSFSSQDFIQYGRTTQDSYVIELFALDINVLIHCNYFPRWRLFQKKL